MKRIRVLALAVLSLPAIAHAQGINLAWNDCITQPSAAANIQYACDGSRNGTPFNLVASFISPVTLHQFVGLELWLDVVLPLGDSHYTDPLPDWWRLGTGECRDGNIATPKTFTAIGTGTTGVCQNPFYGAFTGGGFLYTSEGFLPNRAQLRTVFARSNVFVINAGQQYISHLITFDTVGDVLNDDGLCPGCCQPMMITLSKIELDSVAGSPDGDVLFLTNPATRNFVWWQQTPCNAPTATSRSTWGAVKATYR
jgi:hypothetical protein